MRIELIQKIIDKIRKRGNNSKFICDYGKNNQFYVIRENGEKYTPTYVDGLHIEFSGNNSIVTIKEPFNFNNVFLRCSSDNVISFDKNSWIVEGLDIKCPMRKGSKLIVGKDFSCISAKIFLHDEPDITVKIGDDCMFSFNVVIWPSDGHAILNNKAQAINKGENITINEHVWLGMDTKILKGANIPKNSVVGAGSIYTKGSNTDVERVLSGLYAGSPAKLIKGNINWDRKNYFDYNMEKMYENKNNTKNN